MQFGSDMPRHQVEFHLVYDDTILHLTTVILSAPEGQWRHWCWAVLCNASAMYFWLGLSLA